MLEKMKCQDYLILCVEDTTDWKHSTTRNVVMQADPDLRRTVLVTTKVKRQVGLEDDDDESQCKRRGRKQDSRGGYDMSSLISSHPIPPSPAFSLESSTRSSRNLGPARTWRIFCARR